MPVLQINKLSPLNFKGVIQLSNQLSGRKNVIAFENEYRKIVKEDAIVRENYYSGNHNFYFDKSKKGSRVKFRKEALALEFLIKNKIPYTHFPNPDTTVEEFNKIG